MLTSLIWIKERRLLAFLLSLFFIAISLFGPPNVPVYKYFVDFDISGIVAVITSNDVIFKTPSSVPRILLLLFGLSLLIFVSKIKLNKEYNLKYLCILSLVLSALFLLTILTTEKLYNYLAIPLIIVSVIYYLFNYHNDLKIRESLYIASFFMMAIFPILHTFIIPSDLSEIDNYLRFIFAIPVFLIFRHIRFSELNLLHTISITSILIGFVSIYFYIYSTQINIEGYASTPKVFGNIALLFSILCLISFLYVYQFSRSQSYLSLLGFIMAFNAWGLSGTRSSLILVIMLILVAIFFRNKLLYSLRIPKISLIIVVLFSSVLLFQSGSVDRMINAYESTYNYITEDSEHHWEHKDSIVPRLNIWRGSWNIINDNLIFGVGLSNYNKSLENEIKIGNIPPIRKDPANLTAGMNHAHSQYLDMFAKTGIIGFLILLFFLIMNMVIFLYSLKDRRYNIPASIGLCSTLSYAVFMLFHTVLSHQQSVLFMTIFLSALAGMSAMHTKRDY